MITQTQYLDMLTRAERNVIRDHVLAEEPETRERTMHDKILEVCARRGWIAIHSRMDRPTTQAHGVPDFLILRDGGRVLLVECKSKDGKQTTAQLGFQAWAGKLGHVVHVCRSLDEFLGVAEV
jgi:hypothetical protein